MKKTIKIIGIIGFFIVYIFVAIATANLVVDILRWVNIIK